MARLPTPGEDQGVWGAVLNEYLSVEHNPDGTLKAAGSLADKADTADLTMLEDRTAVIEQDKWVTRSRLADDVIPLPAVGEYSRIAGILTWRETDGGAIVAKPNTDKEPGVFNLIHDSDTGYLFHLMDSTNTSSSSYLIGMGLDSGLGNGLLIANKSATSAKGIVIDQRSTKTDAAGYGFHATQRSPAAPLARLEMQSNDAAPVMQLLAFGSPGPTQQLLYVGDPSGEAGRIRADNGVLQWRRPVEVSDKDGSILSYVSVSDNSGVAETSRSWARLVKNGLEWFSPSGTPGLWWPFRMISNGSQLTIQAGATTTAVGTGTTATMLRIRNNQLGFFGNVAIDRPNVTGSRSDTEATITSLLSALDSLGLITDGTTI